MNDYEFLIRKGLQNPRKVPGYLIGQLFPQSRWGSTARKEDGFVTFENGGFAGGRPTRPELSARIYYEVTELHKTLGDQEFQRSLEIGCGYGRLSAWIADFADTSVAIDPNADAIEQAKILYPDIEFETTLAGDLPFATESFDLVVAWMVLTHIPPDSLEASIEEIERVASPDARIVLCERTKGQRGSVSWPRSKEEYEALFDSFEVVKFGPRGTEPTFDYGEQLERLILEREEPLAVIDDHPERERWAG